MMAGVTESLCTLIRSEGLTVTISVREGDQYQYTDNIHRFKGKLNFCSKKVQTQPSKYSNSLVTCVSTVG